MFQYPIACLLFSPLIHVDNVYYGNLCFREIAAHVSSLLASFQIFRTFLLLLMRAVE